MRPGVGEFAIANAEWNGRERVRGAYLEGTSECRIRRFIDLSEVVVRYSHPEGSDVAVKPIPIPPHRSVRRVGGPNSGSSSSRWRARRVRSVYAFG